MAAVALVGGLVFAGAPAPSARQAAPAFTIADILGAPFPTELTAAARADRLAWAANDRGRRNVWVAEAPGFAARQLTPYGRDDGQELTDVSLSPAGDRVVYVRGGDHGSNWDDDVAVNVESLPAKPAVGIWSVPFGGGKPKLIGEGGSPVISPRGDLVAFVKDNQIFTVPIDGSRPPARIVAVRGDNGEPRWSPDGTKLAFVSGRGDHALIGIYVAPSTPITWIAPSTSRDSSPRWSPDGRRLVFVRRPGTGGAPQEILKPRHVPWAIWTVEVSTGAARPLWKAPETLRGSLPTTHGGTNLHWAASGRIVYLSYADGWPHLYSIQDGGGTPLLLTPGEYMAEHISLSPDGTHVVFAGNTGPDPDDLHRRQVVRVPVDRGTPEVLTRGPGLAWTPVVLGGTARVACIQATAQRPPLPAVIDSAGGPPRIIGGEQMPASFPLSGLVTPRAVRYTASDGVVVHAQLFEGIGGAANKPAIVYVHGGPPRQMLLGWHYSDYYSRAYALNQYLASRGFVVLSINYRLGIGYGYEFHRPGGAGAQGASEYLDVKAAGEFLRARPGVDPARIGIYGGSYGGFLTALALGRNSDLFAAGVDIHGVHDFTTSASGAGAALQAALGLPGTLEPPDRQAALEVAWASSPVSSVPTWRSPVLLIHGDDDRNVRFSQTVDLVQRLAAAKVPFEELVIPDDTHHWMRHANAVRVHEATAAFFGRVFAR
jgi:dipeptidyl aminopeptidase/acylaminoacyl peptidase